MKYAVMIVCLIMASCRSQINNKPTPEYINTCLELQKKRKSLNKMREYCNPSNWNTENLEEWHINRLECRVTILEHRFDIDSLITDSITHCK